MMNASTEDFDRLALDIASTVARLEQINPSATARLEGLHGYLWDRVMTCDVPRLRRHVEELSPSIAGFLDSWTRSTCSDQAPDPLGSGHSPSPRDGGEA